MNDVNRIAKPGSLPEPDSCPWSEVFDGMQEPVFARDAECRILRANAAYCARSGLPLAQIVGEPYWQVYPRQPAAPLCAEAGHAAVDQEITLENGEVLRARTFPVANADGTLRYAVHILEDISARRRVEQALQEQLALYQALLKAQSDVGEGMLIIEDGHVTFANEALCRLTGYSAEEILALPSFIMLVHPDDRARVAENHRRRLAGEDFLDRYEIGIITAAGKRREAEIAVATMLLDDRMRIVVAVLDITRHKQDERQIRFLATHDALTQLPNRALFAEKMASVIGHAKREHKRLALFFIDLDRFKRINDTLGHLVGDRLLQAVGSRLRLCLRESDAVARLGGDEFTVILEDILEPEEVVPVARKLLETLSKPFDDIVDQELVVTPSIGISIYPEDGSDVETLVKHADVAMYRAKAEGRNAYRFFSADMNAHDLEHLLLENSLRRALEKEELLLHYQPKIDLISRRVVGVEALLRWKHPQLGMVSPEQFIHLAEESELILPIGEWAFWTACRQSMAWQRAGQPPLPVVVNLSAKQFRDKNLPDVIANILQVTGMDPDFLGVEVTETSVMANADEAVKILAALRALGIHISIDDFGTGYSSLNYLKRFPIDAIKIDRSFVMDIPHDANDAAITRAVIGLGHSLGLRVIGEGVENEQQLDFLAANGCDEVQGYLFATPLDAEALMAYLQSGGGTAAMNG
jgi:diguanylate cyclase (GGDEF)-like protein/PAS domain S-box-containing protein